MSNNENENQNIIRERCNERWEHGIFHMKDLNFPETIEDFVAVRAYHNCRLKFNDKFFHINMKSMRKEDFLEEIPLLKHKPTATGFYTWVVSSKEGEEKKFTCCKAFSILEIGTLHKTITYRVGAEKVHAAGEIFVDDDKKLYFNFESGTYMKNSLAPASRKRKRGTCGPEQFGDFLIEKMKEFLGNDAEWRSETFLKTYRVNVDIKEKEFELYKKYGAKITLFDDIEECYKARGYRGGSRKSAAKYMKGTRRRRRI
jgi:hypothetical protein